jgi:hypothetical protein
VPAAWMYNAKKATIRYTLNAGCLEIQSRGQLSLLTSPGHRLRWVLCALQAPATLQGTKEGHKGQRSNSRQETSLKCCCSAGCAVCNAGRQPWSLLIAAHANYSATCWPCLALAAVQAEHAAQWPWFGAGSSQAEHAELLVGPAWRWQQCKLNMSHTVPHIGPAWRWQQFMS